MYPYEFAYWLKGYFELSNSSNLSEEQVKIIKEHLQKVFSSGTAAIKVDGADEFVYWLKDYLELNNSNLSERQVRTIEEHLQKVFDTNMKHRHLPSSSFSSGTSGIQAFSGTC
jgi:hypothetical protein